MSVAFVAFTTHDEPAFPGVNVDPTMEHVPDTTTYDTAPEPEPPLVVNDNDDPYVAAVDVTANTD